MINIRRKPNRWTPFNCKIVFTNIRYYVLSLQFLTVYLIFIHLYRLIKAFVRTLIYRDDMGLSFKC